MTHTTQPTVIVIGAGMAGLAAARHLTQAGIRVAVLERSSRVGGRVYTDVVEDFKIDAGAQFIANFYSHTLRLIRELGLQDDLVRIPRRGAVLRGGCLYGVCFDRSLLFTRLVSPLSKLVLLKSLRPLLRHWRELHVHALHRAHRLDVRSIAEYARQELRDELLEYVIQPPLSGIFYWTPEHTSQAMFFLLLKASLGVKLLTLRHGLGRLAEAMAADLHVRRNAEVRSVTPNDSGGYTVRVRIDGRESQLIADGVVCATSAREVPALFPDLNAQQRAFFKAVGYSANATTAIGVGRRLPSDFYGLLFPRLEVEALATAAIQSAKNPAQVPAGRDLVVLYPSGPASRQLLDREDAVIRDVLRADLQRAGAAYNLGGDELFCQVYRWYDALPEFDVGYFGRLRAFVDGEIESSCLVFAGDYLGGPFLEGAITSGLQAAGSLLGRLGARPISP